MRRRAFIEGIAALAAALWPLAACAQLSALPKVGFLRSSTLADVPDWVTAFRQGLKEAGFVEGQNVAIEFRTADNQPDRLPVLVTDLIHQPVAVIVGNTESALAAKAATTTVPIVFATGSDPVRDGLVASLNRPGGNVTGVSFFSAVVGAKRLELLRQMVPNATIIAMLVNPNIPLTEAERRDVQTAAQAIGQQLVFVDVSNERDIETAFATSVQQVIGATDERRKNLVSALAAQGFVEGQNLVFEQRSADAQPRRLDGLVGELKAVNVDVIVTFGYPSALAAKNSAGGIPVVVTGAGDPVATGLVDGLARPGGNLTGVTELSTDLSTKRLEILKDAIPKLRSVAMLWNADDLGMTLRYKAAESAAGVLGVKVQALGVREPDDFDRAFAEMQRKPPQAILMVSDALTMLNRKHVVEFANAHRLPTIFEVGAIVREGGLMSYGPKQSEIGEHAAALVARILRGARPADLPLELPTHFEFLVNLKAAQALGINLPSTLISRADEVIE